VSTVFIHRQLRYGFSGHVKVVGIFFDANALIPDGFRGGKRRSGTGEWVENHTLSKGKY